MHESVFKEVMQELAPTETQTIPFLLLQKKNFFWGVGGEFHQPKQLSFLARVFSESSLFY